MANPPDAGVPVAAAAPGHPLPEPADDEPIELLVQLAADGEIDPWDIDIVRVTDKFLERLDEGNLRDSARALFYASVLLRMKSEILLEDTEPEPDPVPAFFDQPDHPGPGPGLGPGPGPGSQHAPTHAGPDPIQTLEGELERRLDRQRARGKPETLDELVRELRDAERDHWWKDTRTYDTSNSPRGFRRGTQTLDYHASDDHRQADEPTEADVTRTAHAEDMEAIIQRVRKALTDRYDTGRHEVLFREIDTAGGSRIETYLGVLFLDHRGFVRLEQDELFGDLWILDRHTPTGP